MDMELVDRIRFEKETKEQLAALQNRVTALENASVKAEEVPAGDLEQVPAPEADVAAEPSAPTE